MAHRLKQALQELRGNYKLYLWFLIVICFTAFLLRDLALPFASMRYFGIRTFAILMPGYFALLFYLFFRISHVSIKSTRFLFGILLMILNYLIVFAFFFRGAGLYATHCLPLDSACPTTVIHDGIVSLYFSATTLTTVGYGDFIPANNYGRLFAPVEALSGYFVLASIVAIITRRIHDLHG